MGVPSATRLDVTGGGKAHCLIDQDRCRSHRTWAGCLSPGPAPGTVPPDRPPRLGTCDRGSTAPRAALLERDAQHLPATAQSNGSLTRHRRGSTFVLGMMRTGSGLHASVAQVLPIPSSAHEAAPGPLPSAARRAAPETSHQTPAPALRVPGAGKPLGHRRAKEPAPAPRCLHREGDPMPEACVPRRVPSGQNRPRPGHRQSTYGSRQAHPPPRRLRRWWARMTRLATSAHPRLSCHQSLLHHQLRVHRRPAVEVGRSDGAGQQVRRSVRQARGSPFRASNHRRDPLPSRLGRAPSVPGAKTLATLAQNARPSWPLVYPLAASRPGVRGYHSLQGRNGAD
jgi:hypothetical protein